MYYPEQRGADFNLIFHAAGRGDVEIGKYGMKFVHRPDTERFLPRAQFTPVDFVLVGCAPVMGAWHGDIARRALGFGLGFHMARDDTLIIKYVKKEVKKACF